MKRKILKTFQHFFIRFSFHRYWQFTGPANTLRVFHVETTWKWSIPRRFNVDYTWYVSSGIPGKGRRPLFIALYHLHLLTNINYLFATLLVRWLPRILIASLVANRRLVDKIHHLIDDDDDDDGVVISVCLFDDSILGFCYSSLTRKADRFELIPTIIFELQANLLTRCAIT